MHTATINHPASLITPLRIGVFLTALAVAVLLVLTASNRMQAGAVHDPIRVDQVRAAFVQAGWPVEAGEGEAQHPALSVPGTRLTVDQGRAVVDVFLFDSTAERVEAEQRLYTWNSTMLRVDGATDEVAVRVTSLGNALLVIVGHDLPTVNALHATIAAMVRG